MTSSDTRDIKAKSPNLFDPTKVYGLEPIAKHFGVSLRQVQRWAKMPGFPRDEARFYSLVAVARWRDEVKMAAGQKKEKEPADLDEEGGGAGKIIPGSKKYWELEDKKHQALIRELEYRKRLGEVVERKEVDALFVSRVMIVTQGLEALARSLPPLLTNKSEREMEPIISGRVRALRDLFARPLPEQFGPESEPILGTVDSDGEEAPGQS